MRRRPELSLSRLIVVCVFEGDDGKVSEQV